MVIQRHFSIPKNICIQNGLTHAVRMINSITTAGYIQCIPLFNPATRSVIVVVAGARLRARYACDASYLDRYSYNP